VGGLRETFLSVIPVAPRSLNRPLSLRANFSWTFLGNVVYAGCQWGMLTALAKLGTPEMVGRFSLGLAVTAPVFMLTNLQLREVQATDARHDYEFGHYLALRLAMTTFALLAVAAITILSGYHGEMIAVILIIGLGKAFDSVSGAYHGLMQQRERMDRIALALLIKGPLALIALTVTVYLTGSVLWGVVALAIAFATVLFTYELGNARRLVSTDDPQMIHPRWEWQRLAHLAWLALPLGLVMMLLSLNTNIPRYFVERVLGEAELGLFAAMAYIKIAGSTVASALGQSASPRLAQYYARGQRTAFRTLLLRLVSIGVILGIVAFLGALLLGRQVLSLLYRPEYAAHPRVFAWLMVAAGLEYVASFLGHGMTAARRFRPQLPLFVIAVVVVVVGCVLWIPSQGLMGAAWALVCGALTKVAGSAYIVWRAWARLPLSEGG
jgi:O-antigen/teichoic acid export membrane protein